MPIQQPNPSQQIYKSPLALFFDNIIGGVGWGVGSVIGAALVVYLIGVFITKTQTVPFLSSIMAIISKQVTQH